MPSSQDFTSEGFDLDNIASAQDGEDVVLELNGGITVLPSDQDNKQEQPSKTSSEIEIDNVLVESEEWKLKGNAEFKAKNYQGAHDYYCNAIESCPGEINGSEILKLKEEFELKEREKANERHRKEQEKRLRLPKSPSTNSNEATNNSAEQDEEEEEEEEEEEPDNSLKPAEFQPPTHPHAKSLSIYHSNRAATRYHLTRHSECIEDCSISILLNPSYVKPYLRRSAAYEATEQLPEALEDMKMVLQLDSSNKFARKEVKRLEKLEEERMEKLKTETIGKLKDLGNSILGNFGLSLDNFQAQKDPNTGSYSISFNNS